MQMNKQKTWNLCVKARPADIESNFEGSLAYRKQKQKRAEINKQE